MENKKYKLTDFLKSSFLEHGIMLSEAVYVSVPIACLTSAFTNNPGIIAAGALAPQAATYLGFRAYELFGKDENLKGIIRGLKEIPSIMAERLDSIENKVK